MKYFCVRIVNQLIMSKYPPDFPPEVQQLGKLTVIQCNKSDVSTLNEINSFHVNYLYGRHQFTENDALVTYEDFMTFYNLLNSCTNKKQSQQLLSK